MKKPKITLNLKLIKTKVEKKKIDQWESYNPKTKEI